STSTSTAGSHRAGRVIGWPFSPPPTAGALVLLHPLCGSAWPMDPPVLEKASVLCYRMYDVADEIDLAVAESILARDASRLRLSRSGAEYLLLPNPPLIVGLGRRSLPVPEGPLEVEARARLFDHGAASIVLAVPVPPGTTLDALTPVADRLYDGPEVDALALELVEGLRQAVVRAMENPHLWSQAESYS